MQTQLYPIQSPNNVLFGLAPAEGLSGQGVLRLVGLGKAQEVREKFEISKTLLDIVSIYGKFK